MVKKSIKYLLYLLTTLLLIVVLLVLFTQTPWFENLVRKQAIKIVNNQLNAHVSIQDLKSNWYDYLEIYGVTLNQKTDSSLIAKAGSLKLHFNLWALLDKKIHIHSASVHNLSGLLEQDAEGNWTITQIVPSSKDSTSSSSDFSFSIELDTILLNNINLATKTAIHTIPDSINHINLNASLFYQNQLLDIHLRQFNLISHNPNLTIKNIKTHFIKDGPRIQVDSLLIATTHSFLNGQATYVSISNSDGQLEASPLSHEEIQFFVPSVQLPNSPNIDLSYSSKNDTTFIKLSLAIGEEQINAKAKLFHLDDFTKQKQKNIPFTTNLTLKNVHPENWWKLNKTNSQLNGEIFLSGQHLLDFKTWQQLQANLSESSYLNHHFQHLKIDAVHNNDSIVSTVLAQSHLGRVNGNINIYNFFSKPKYHATLDIDSLLLSEFLSKEAGEVNANIIIDGSHFNPDSMDIQAKITLNPSNIYGLPFDSATINASLLGKQVEIYDSNINLPGSSISTEGSFNLKSQELTFASDFSLDSLSFLQNYQVPKMAFNSANGKIYASGKIDSLESNGELNLSDFNGFSINGKHISTVFDAYLIKEEISVNSSFQIKSLESGNFLVDTIHGDVQYLPDLVLAEVFAENDSSNAKIKTRVELTDTLKVNINDFQLNSTFANYYTTDSLNAIQYYNNQFSIIDFTLKDEMSPQFSINANGTFGAHNTEDFHLNINNFDLGTLNRIQIIEEQLNGTISGQFSLSGEPKSPELNSTFNIRNSQYKNAQIPDIEGEISVKNDTLKSIVYNPEHPDMLHINFATPLEASFDSTGFTFNLSDQFEALLQLDSINIAAPTESITQMDAQGSIQANLQAKGSYSKPLLYGFFKLNDGAYNNPGLGIDYSNAQIELNFDSNKVAIDTFIIKRDKGYLTMTGEASFDTSFVSGKIHSSTLEANAEDFYVIKHRDYSALINARSFYENINDTARFGGNIKVIRSEFYIPAFTESDEDNVSQEVPLLVQATTQTDSLADVSTEEVKKKSEQDASQFIKNLQGRLKLEIPRNTWLKSEDMSIEIWGDLEIEKSNPYFELYGEVGINRGYYILYGKKFMINDGKITLQGGEKIDPFLDLHATYTYRGPDKQKRNLKLSISDKLSEPSISFTLDGISIPEGDAISILVFGKTKDELSYSGQNGIAGSIGTDMLAKMVTSQLSKTLGTRLNLDMIEVTATENWQSAAFVVGKYVTNDLFVIYQRGFGETDGDEITPEMVILEYELNRILFVRLQSGSSKESGFDVILKFESKND